MKIGRILIRVILALVFIVAISSCTKPGGPTVAAGDVDYYTCTMHPWVHSKNPALVQSARWIWCLSTKTSLRVTRLIKWVVR